MDDGRHENGRHMQDFYRGSPSPWNMTSQEHVREPNALVMNKKIMSIIAERDAAVRERNAAISEKNEALAARDEALLQRDEAFSQRDTARMERDNAFAAFHIRDNSMNCPLSRGAQRGSKRLHYPLDHGVNMVECPYSTKDFLITDAVPVSVLSSEALKLRQTKRSKQNRASRASKSSRKKVGEDLNRQTSTDGIKYRSEWDTQDLSLNVVSFDETTMPVPVCSCTGMSRQCYKWGKGGWQSSCCTTKMSMYPLPQMENKRHARMGGRKMSGSVFTRLLSRLAAEGDDLSVPVDLKEYWARHGTNRYITIK